MRAVIIVISIIIIIIRRGLTPLMRAVTRQKVSCATVLLSDSRVDLDARDNYKRSPQELKRWENFDVLN